MATFIDAGVHARTAARMTGPDATITRRRGPESDASALRTVRPSEKRAPSTRPRRRDRGLLRGRVWSTVRVAVCEHSRSLGEWGWLASAAAFTFLIVLLVGLFALDDGASAVPGGAAVVQVRDGDTLWGLARRFAPDSDPRAVVQRIVELNGLDRAVPEAGQTLVVPTGRV